MAALRWRSAGRSAPPCAQAARELLDAMQPRATIGPERFSHCGPHQRIAHSLVPDVLLEPRQITFHRRLRLSRARDGLARRIFMLPIPVPARIGNQDGKCETEFRVEHLIGADVAKRILPAADALDGLAANQHAAHTWNRSAILEKRDQHPWWSDSDIRLRCKFAPRPVTGDILRPTTPA